MTTTKKKTSKIKTFFNGRKWNSVRTRKKILISTMALAFCYTVVNLVMTGFGITPDGTLTSELFSYCKWLVATGTSITLADKIFVPSSEEEDE